MSHLNKWKLFLDKCPSVEFDGERLLLVEHQQLPNNGMIGGCSLADAVSAGAILGSDL